MIKKSAFLFIVTLISFYASSQNDTIFIMRHGIIIYQKPLSEIDSILYYRDQLNLTGTFFDDRDSTLYPTIIIGNQIWFAANLRYLPSVSPPTIFSSLTPHYYVYNYLGNSIIDAKNTINYQNFGALYNYKAALTACPNGWHLPTSSEYDILVAYLGGSSNAGSKLKSTDGTYWDLPNSGATNESGFSGQAGGFYRSQSEEFKNLKNFGYYWSSPSTYQHDVAAGYILAVNTTGVIANSFLVYYGFSIRCIRDPF